MRTRLEWKEKRSGSTCMRPAKMAGTSRSMVMLELGTICPILYCMMNVEKVGGSAAPQRAAAGRWKADSAARSESGMGVPTRSSSRTQIGEKVASNTALPSGRRAMQRMS
ncbi:hypothetical protein D3C81_800420 [compost metagenome]